MRMHLVTSIKDKFKLVLQVRITTFQIRKQKHLWRNGMHEGVSSWERYVEDEMLSSDYIFLST